MISVVCSIEACGAPAKKRGMCGLHYQRWWKHGDPLFIPVRSSRRPVRDRLFANTTTTPTGCIEKMGTGNPAGYKLIQVNGKILLAHRVSYQIAFGKIPEGMFICHRCDNPSCINPKHLFAGTQKENLLDAIRKGRKVPNYGERAGGARLTIEAVLAIRASSDSHKSLAARFGVSPSLISRIRSRDVWAQF